MRAEDVKNQARGRWRGIHEHFGVDIGSGKHKSCPACGGDDRFRYDDKNGDGTYFCNCCGAGDGLALLMKVFSWSFPETLERVAEVVGCCEVIHNTQKENPAARLRALWKSSTTTTGKDPVSKYLRNRGLMYRPDCLRYCDACYEPDTKKKMPAMLAIVSDSDGNPVTIHRTYINKDGYKSGIDKPKKLMPGKAKLTGGAIRLFEPDGRLGVAEGIETAIACKQLTGIPTWATISTTIMESFVPPEGVRSISIFADNDANFAGLKSAYALANRLYRDDYVVEVLVPDIPGDFNDVLLKQRELA